MELEERIKKFGEFFEKSYHAELLEKVRKDEKFLVVDFSDISKFDPDLASDLLDQPDETLEAAEASLQDFDIENIADFKIRIKGLPETQKIMVREVRSKNLGSFLTIEGVVRQKSDVRPQVTSARFECPNCGNIIGVIQLDKKFKEPTRCGCGRKGKFRLISKELVDAQGLFLEEAPEDLEGGEQPKRINVFLKRDLVSPMSDKKTNPGSKIRVNGIVKEDPIILRTGGQSTRFDLLFEANYVESVEEGFSDITISKDELKEIRDIANDPKVYTRLIGSIVPSIWGYDRIKEALVFQLMGGVRKTRKDGIVTRGDIHILLIGDPGSGKSQILKRIGKVAPKGRFISGKGVSGAGLTAAVVRDEFLQGWALEAGALVLANKGICCIDELDKMTPEDRSAMHEALEGQTVTISKANIQATLRAETTVLAAANPKFGRFDPYEDIPKQIDLPPTLINRFDLIFPIKDLPEKTRDDKMAKFILNLHQHPDTEAEEMPSPLLRKYIAYARQNINPVLTDSAIEIIKEYYLKMRASGYAEGGIKTIPISARQLEGLVRLAEAAAKIRLSKKVTKKDAQKAIDLLDFCLRQIAMDQETGAIDIDRIATGVRDSKRSHIVVVKEIISELENRMGKTIPIDDIVKEAREREINEDKVEEVIERLKRSGDLFEPRRGLVQRI